MFPILIEKPFGIEWITVHSFGVMVVVSFLMGSWLIGRLSVKANIDKKSMANLALYLLLIDILGARIMYVAVNYDQFRDAPWTKIFRLWEGGIVWYGGFIAGSLFAIQYLKRKKISIWLGTDILIVGTMFALAFARWGCFFAGCCYGAECGEGWSLGVIFDDPNSVVGKEYGAHALPTPALHPTQIYSSLAAFAVTAILLKVNDKKRFAGQVFAVGLILYPIGRFLIEIVRADRTRGTIGPLSTSQALGIGVAAVGVLLYRVLSKHRRPEGRPAAA